MTWDKVFIGTGICFLLSTGLVIIILIYRYISNFINLRHLISERNNIIKRAEYLNTPEARFSLPLQISNIDYEIKINQKMSNNLIDWDEARKSVFIFTAAAAIGLILAHFGMGGGSGGRMYFD